MPNPTLAEPNVPRAPKLLDRVRESMRTSRYSPRTCRDLFLRKPNRVGSFFAVWFWFEVQCSWRKHPTSLINDQHSSAQTGRIDDLNTVLM
jgi:hypothetical protein